MRFGIASRPDRPEASDVVREILDYLATKDVEVFIDTDTAMEMELPVDSLDLGEMNVDIVVTIGGDGTIMRAAMLMNDPETPILGVNMGSRGFLTEVLPEDFKPALDRIIKGDYALEECMKLSSRSPELKSTFPDALNEVLVASSLPSKTLDMRLTIDGVHVLDVQADGVIVAPPTGSTAYNLSAGGSIMSPNVDAMILTAICPYNYFKSVVIPSHSRVTIELLKPKVDALVIIDGREYEAIKPGSTVEVWKSEHVTRFIRFRSFYERLSRRLVFRQVR